MPLSVYVHIPYCLQRCRYCDFTTFEWKEILPPEQYVEQVIQEIRRRHHFWTETEIATLYFGGGTPSLLAPELIVAICRELANVGFTFQDKAEITIEINPATLTEEKLETYLSAGINRFSVGAQTFNDQLLTMCGRKHSAAETRTTLDLLKNYNYSFDLLFALPGQTLKDLSRDLEEVLQYRPPHLSAYCLTVPESHPMSIGRPPEREQIAMFAMIEREILKIGLKKYEISNFAKPGFESRHNGVYWRDQNYWGLGLSSHSYRRKSGTYGMRFWNPKSLKEYASQVNNEGESFESVLKDKSNAQFEKLAAHEALTDFCHMFLRTTAGMSENAVRQKFANVPLAWPELEPRLQGLLQRELLMRVRGNWKLTREGQLLSNQVLEELTFLTADLTPNPPSQPNRTTLAATPPTTGLTRSIGDSYCAV